ncbi:PREDICTED: uncharacterized protein LOC101294258 [Fragaria vesca subsp. vesca]
MDNVVVTVVKDVEKSCSSTSVVVDDCAEMIDENDYLDEWGSYLSHAGQKFESIADFRDKLRKFAVQSGFIMCYLGMIQFTLMLFVQIVMLTTVAGKYLDLLLLLISAFTLRGLIMFIHAEPREIMSNFKSTYGYEISYKVASRAKKREAVLETNPISSVVFEVDESTERFKRVFVAYAGQIQGFKFSLPVLYVDGAFGKSKYKGQILAATGRNGNKGFFPLALCFCDSETEENWLFFFKHLKALLEPQGRIITFISDRGVDLLKAFDLIFPGNPHLYCYHYL